VRRPGCCNRVARSGPSPGHSKLGRLAHDRLAGHREVSKPSGVSSGTSPAARGEFDSNLCLHADSPAASAFYNSDKTGGGLRTSTAAIGCLVCRVHLQRILHTCA
jgi:hypothetical protein